MFPSGYNLAVFLFAGDEWVTRLRRLSRDELRDAEAQLAYRLERILEDFRSVPFAQAAEEPELWDECRHRMGSLEILLRAIQHELDERDEQERQRSKRGSDVSF